MKTKDFRAKAPEELQKDFIAFKKELFNLRFQKVQGAIEKTHRVRQLKRAVAKVSTLLNEIKLGIKLRPRESGDSLKVKAISAPKESIKADVAPKKLVKSVTPKATKEAEPKVKKRTVKKDKKNV
jgi:large subunit ribosomal protein L29